REQAGNSAFLDQKDRAIRAVGFTASVDTALQEDSHEFRWRPFTEDNLARGEVVVGAIRGEPPEVVLRKVGKHLYFSQFFHECSEVGLGHGRFLSVETHETFARY